MPVCKNDASKTYTGTEPSPKGLGYCAHAEKAGIKRIGRDGNHWIIATTKTDIMRWVRFNDSRDKLAATLSPWWRVVTNGGVMVIYRGGEYIMVQSKKKTQKARLNEIKTVWQDAAADPKVVAIVWSAMSYDVFESFLNHIEKTNKTRAILKAKDVPALLAKSYKKYFKASEFLSPKDHTLKS